MPLYKEVQYIGPPYSYNHSTYPKYGITVHSTENDAAARNEALYAQNRRDGVSSHFYVDNTTIIQSLDTNYGAHHVGSTYGNRHLISYEFIGKASWSKTRWIDSIDFDAAAAQMARDCKTWNIPARRLSVDMLRNHERGICTHNDCRLALGGTDHTDPGSNFPMTLLIDKVAAILSGDDVEAKDVWAHAFASPANDVDTARPAADWIKDAMGFGKKILTRLDAIEAKIDAIQTGGATAEEVKKLVGEDLLDDNS